MTLAVGADVDVNDLLVQHNPDGAHKGVSNLRHGLAANRPASPVKGDVYLSEDTQERHECYLDGAWTLVNSGGTDEKVKVSPTDTTTGYLLSKLEGGDGATVERVNAGGDEKVKIRGGLAPNIVVYYNGATPPAGWTELTQARGRVIVGVPPGGTLLGTLGTALTNLQDKTHTHTVPAHLHGMAKNSNNEAKIYATDGSTFWRSESVTTPTNAFPARTENVGELTTGAASHMMPYIQLMTIIKS